MKFWLILCKQAKLRFHRSLLQLKKTHFKCWSIFFNLEKYKKFRIWDFLRFLFNIEFRNSDLFWNVEIAPMCFGVQRFWFQSMKNKVWLMMMSKSIWLGLMIVDKLRISIKSWMRIQFYEKPKSQIFAMWLIDDSNWQSNIDGRVVHSSKLQEPQYA